MAPPFLRINAVTRANRDETIACIRTAITASHGWVLDVKLFSNVSVSFSFEIPLDHKEQFCEALAATELRLTPESRDLLARFCQSKEFAVADPQTSDIAGTLQITFIHNEPDLRIEVPRVPE